MQSDRAITFAGSAFLLYIVNTQRMNTWTVAEWWDVTGSFSVICTTLGKIHGFMRVILILQFSAKTKQARTSYRINRETQGYTGLHHWGELWP